MLKWLKQLDAGCVLQCVILPKSSKTQIVGLYGEPPRLKIKIAAPPVDGEANEALIAYLAKYLKIPKSSFRILSGHNNKHKDVLIADANAATRIKQAWESFDSGEVEQRHDRLVDRVT